MQITAVQRLFSLGPVIVFFAIEYSALVTVYCLFKCWPPFDSVVFFVNFVPMLIFQVFGMYTFVCASLVGPGYLPLNWKPDNPKDEQFLSYCKICKGFKAPRAHHCRRCNRCVMKMDHHCPWMNNCCGHRNHVYLTYFCLAVVCGRGQSMIILLSCMYKMYMAVSKPTELPLIFFFYNFAVAISIGSAFGTAVLLFVNLYSIVKNKTRFERFVVSKAKGTNFVYPYDFGVIKNLKLAFCAKRHYNNDDVNPNDGILWKVKEGCDQYTLTAEAVRQNKERRKTMKDYVIVNGFNGSILPRTMGLGVMFCIPLSIDRRIKVNKGEKVLVACVKRYWLYGEVQADTDSSDVVLPRGWFPSCCAVEIIKSKDESEHKNDSSMSKKND